MNAATLQDFIQQDSSTASMFRGTYSVDTLPTRVTDFPAFIILNTAKSRVKYGHWTLLFFINDKHVIFFDSFGRSPNNVNNGDILARYMHSKNVQYNKRFIQGVYSQVCGFYVLYVAYYLCRNASLSSILSVFNNELRNNDYLVVKFVHDIYL